MEPTQSPTTSTDTLDTRAIRILHVDDDEGFLDLTAAFLREENERFEVHSSTDAETALDRLQEEQFDCVVSDFDMPGLDGVEFLLQVRERWPELPFVLFTGKGSEEIASDAISAGVSDYLQKGGVDRFELLDTRLTTLVEKYWAETELATMQRRYALVGTVSADAFFEWDVETDVVWRSDGYARVFGYDEDEVGSGLDWWTDRLHPADRDDVLAGIHAVFRAGETHYEYLFRLRLGDGSYGRISARVHVDYDDEGTPTRVTGALTDITDYYTQQRELDWANARVDLALRGSEMGIWEWDMTTDEVVWDETTNRLFGFTDSDFDGTREAYLDHVPPDDVPAIQDAIQQAIDTGETYEVEHRIHPRGTDDVRWVQGKGTVIVDDGDPVRLIGIIHDVTDRRSNEELLQRQNERLDEFTSVVSHDLRNPLSVASANLQLLDASDEQSKEHYEAVEEAHKRMDALLTDLLGLAREGETIDTLTPVSLDAAARTAWSMVETGAATLTVDDAVVLADARRLGQLFENLLRNSVEHGSTGPRSHTREDSVEHGSTGSRATPDDSVEHGGTDGDDGPLSVTVGPLDSGFFVEDDGVGIPHADRTSVFEPGHTTSAFGTGFGLAIVHRIATAHGWDVAVTTSDTGGARFEFTGVAFDDDS